MSKCLSTIIVSVLAGFSLAQAQDVTGDWLGTLVRPSGESRVAMHIAKSEGGLKGTLDFIEQGVSGVPMESIQLAGPKLTFQISAVQASFEGKVDAGSAAIEGAATGQSGTAPLK